MGHSEGVERELELAKEQRQIVKDLGAAGYRVEFLFCAPTAAELPAAAEAVLHVHLRRGYSPATLSEIRRVLGLGKN
jgi:hypothetical protein